MSMLYTLLDPERRAKAALDQVKLRARHSGRVVAHDPAIATFYWGQQREQTALTSLELNPLQEWVLSQLAEGLAAQARYAEAAAVAPNATHRQNYNERAMALEFIGDRLCQCPSFQLFPDPNDAKGHSFVNPRDIERVFDGDKIITLMRCSFCKVITAR